MEIKFTTSPWCYFVNTNYLDQLMLLNLNEIFVPITVGFRFICIKPFGRLLASFDAATQDPKANGALRWLFDNVIAQSEDAVRHQSKNIVYI